VVNYKEINDRVIPENYPLPRTQDLFRAMEGMTLFSTLDLNSGFYQIPIVNGDKELLAFTTVQGLFTFNRLPQGFRNSSAVFQRIINKIFSEHLYKKIVCFIDDLCIFGKSFEDKLENLNIIFKLLNDNYLSLKTNKCKFLYSKINLLGHKMSNKVIAPLTKNISAIKYFKTPSNLKEIRRFLGMASYYRRHIKDFAHIAGPLTNLTKIQENKIKIKWGEEYQDSFNELKDRLIKAPVLSHFHENNQLILFTDASIRALGAVLEQRDQYGNVHPIGYASRKVLDTERIYSLTTLEFLGLVYGCEYFREFLYSRKCIVFCDNISLQYYKTLKTPTAQIARLILKLLDYDFEIIYKQGKKNEVADALSRQTIKNIIDYAILGYKVEIKEMEKNSVNTQY